MKPKSLIINYVRTSKPYQDGQSQNFQLEDNFPVEADHDLFDLGVSASIPLASRRLGFLVHRIRHQHPKASILIRASHVDRILKATRISQILKFVRWLHRNHASLEFASPLSVVRVRNQSHANLMQVTYDLVLDRMLELGEGTGLVRRPYDLNFPPLKRILDRAATDLLRLSRHSKITTNSLRRVAFACRVFGVYNELLRLYNNLGDHRRRDPGGWGSHAAHYDVFHVVMDLERRNQTPATIASHLHGRFKSLRGKSFTRGSVRSLLSSPGYLAFKRSVHLPKVPRYDRPAPVDGFYKKQRQALNILAEGKNLLFVIRTSFGKTLVAMERHRRLSKLFPDHLTIFVVPYKALVDDLCARHGGISLRGKMDDPTNVANLRSLQQGTEGGLLFITPDKLQPGVLVNQTIIAAIKQRSSRFLVVDEVDCVLEDADFRDAYLHFNKAVKAIQPTQILALTASAPKGFVRRYLKRNVILPTQDWEVLTGSLNRRNLFYQHARFDNITARKTHLVKIVRRALRKNWRGVIYIDSIKQVERTYKLLCDLGFSVARYHSKRPDKDNQQVIRDFQDERHRIVVATSGFGRGLDFPVDFVVVAHTPSNLTSLVQYFGRTGRDGRPAYCWWLTTDADYWFLEHVEEGLQKSKLKKSAKDYLTSQIKRIQSGVRKADTRCLRGILLKSQNRKRPEVSNPNYCCLNCSRMADQKAV